MSNLQFIAQQQDDFLFESGGQIIFCYDGVKEGVEVRLLKESSMIRETILQNQQQQQIQQSRQQIQQESIVVQLPKWITVEVFSVFRTYIEKKSLNQWSDKSLPLNDQTLQRLLWMGDYFQMEEFQQKCITDVLIPRIRVNNCLLFLNEAFKKLKACEDSCDIWYMLLNTGMNFTAKNLITIFRTNPNELHKINNKIMDEIIERSLKYFKKKQPLNFDFKDMVDVILFIRNVPDVTDLLSLQHKSIFTRKINYSNHPSISWKLSNINSIMNKETNPFRFNEHQWKLLAKMEEDKATKSKVLKIYLKLENSSSSSSSSSSASSTTTTTTTATTASAIEQQSLEAAGMKKIIAIYFLLKLNEKEYEENFTIKHIVLERKVQILLCEFEGQKLEAFENKKLEFTVYLNTDYIYSLLLNHIAKSLDTFTMNQKFTVLSQDDIVAILRSLPFVPATQEKSLYIVNLILTQEKHPITNVAELLSGIEFSVVSEGYLNQTVAQLVGQISSSKSQEMKRNLCEVVRILNEEITKKQNKSTTQLKFPSNPAIDSLAAAIVSDDALKQHRVFDGASDTQSESDGIVFNPRPDDNFRHYMQRNADPSEMRKKNQSSDQFGLRKAVSDDTSSMTSMSSAYNFHNSQVNANAAAAATGGNMQLQQQLGGLLVPSNKQEKVKRTPPNMSGNKSASSVIGSSNTSYQDEQQQQQYQHQPVLFSKHSSNISSASDQPSTQQSPSPAYFLGSDAKNTNQQMQQIPSQQSSTSLTNHFNSGNQKIGLLNSPSPNVHANSSNPNNNSLHNSGGSFSAGKKLNLIPPQQQQQQQQLPQNNNNNNQNQFLRSPQPQMSQGNSQLPNLMSSQSSSPPRPQQIQQLQTNGQAQGGALRSIKPPAQGQQQQQQQLFNGSGARPPLHNQQSQAGVANPSNLQGGATSGAGAANQGMNLTMPNWDQEREIRKAAICGEIDLKNYVLNKNLLIQFGDFDQQQQQQQAYHQQY